MLIQNISNHYLYDLQIAYSQYLSWIYLTFALCSQTISHWQNLTTPGWLVHAMSVLVHLNIFQVYTSKVHKVPIGVKMDFTFGKYCCIRKIEAITWDESIVAQISLRTSSIKVPSRDSKNAIRHAPQTACLCKMKYSIEYMKRAKSGKPWSMCSGQKQV